MSSKKKCLAIIPAAMMVGLGLVGASPADAAAQPEGRQQLMAVFVGDGGPDRRPGDVTSADDHRVEAVSPYTEYCIKKYPFDPEKAYECSLGWVVD